MAFRTKYLTNKSLYVSVFNWGHWNKSLQILLFPSIVTVRWESQGTHLFYRSCWLNDKIWMCYFTVTTWTWLLGTIKRLRDCNIKEPIILSTITQQNLKTQQSLQDTDISECFVIVFYWLVFILKFWVIFNQCSHKVSSQVKFFK